ncbi:MAG: hypothetical protein JGK17_09565 [Microcoleus sp. PH2017_10_PVI_O_A]|uniref:hypothetical protein n=1 Tax=unclassified Microcoleus TaxID=2642155 RepID=UPI001D868FDE|nr:MULTISPECIES: hypothetical protein [unclassified Microcoleus]TAE80533.1 MAG: hypothetical protein EAZ83_17775 [Oscillatoriales cyanobacterium]MCC3405824.1 hypothetical protein [Microcoleus sp. PH2017_10_PVI_O_A]MCC3459870.1 hypothetical protein [Microcoleus sp. PH2017_11_PCY_U_A]MCC3478330.1 hypothetical protein [Microcoleus sp. PH2017_12_PCY_D_A]MCC3528801.1 hypothetical protein [Microcoleus sp. PH2017_21_RUC_O_A]
MQAAECLEKTEGHKADRAFAGVARSRSYSAIVEPFHHIIDSLGETAIVCVKPLYNCETF